MDKATLRHKALVLQEKSDQAFAVAGGLFLVTFPMMPGLVSNWNNTTEVSFFGLKMPFERFYKIWTFGMFTIAMLAWYKQDQAKHAAERAAQQVVSAPAVSNPRRLRASTKRLPKYYLASAKRRY